jgi:eukaryotic-like serine/threonine-protein kinase
MAADESPRLLAGRYRLGAVIGQGGMGTVWQARDEVLNRNVAVKEIVWPALLDPAEREVARRRAVREAQLAARLHHPNVVTVYDIVEEDDRPCIVMELVPFRSLREVLAEDGPVPPEQAARIGLCVLAALRAVHEAGVVHRDVKPANVRIDHRGDVYLMDFGIAYRPDSNELPLPPGTILGTPAYVAPEQAEGGRTDPLPASDQYSLGAVFYELLCGRPPFVGPLSYVLFQAIHREPPSPRTVAPRVPRALAAICLKALAKDPDRRYPDCQGLADDLRRWLRGETPLAHRRGWVRFGRWGTHDS